MKHANTHPPGKPVKPAPVPIILQPRVDLSIPNRDFLLLHPLVRSAAVEILERMKMEGIPFQLYEGYRSPDRQQYLYAQGRTKPGKVVTRARPFESYHQFGLAADFVLKENGRWSWDDKGVRMDWWNRLHDLGDMFGLEAIGWEAPHLQISGVSLHSLQQRQYPGGGDKIWWDNLNLNLTLKV